MGEIVERVALFRCWRLEAGELFSSGPGWGSSTRVGLAVVQEGAELISQTTVFVLYRALLARLALYVREGSRFDWPACLLLFLLFSYPASSFSPPEV